MPRRFHIAFAVAGVDASIADYSERLGCEPEVVVAGEYALWRTAELNFSIRKATGAAGFRHIGFRHIGWEDAATEQSSEAVDLNGTVWERFSAAQQRQEIEALWPGATVKSLR